MKKTVKVIGIFFLVLIVIAAIPALIPDEDYTQGAKQWLDEANTIAEVPDELNSFNALIGFNRGKDKDMVVEGAAMVAELNKRVMQYRAKGEAKPELEPRWTEHDLKLTNAWSNVEYKVFEGNPVEWLASNQGFYEKDVADNRVLLDRYRKITSMKQFSNTMIPDINSPFASFSDFISINKLNNLSIIYEYTHNKQRSAINRLRDSINFSKLMMKESSQLITKMVAVALLQTNLETYSALLDNVAFNPEHKLDIQNLDKEERAMLKVFQGEFALMSTVFYEPNMQDLGSDGVTTLLIDYVGMKLYLRPRKVENMAHKKIWMPLLAQTNISLSERKKQNDTSGDFDSTWWDYYLDPVGNILLMIATPAYFEYTDRVDHSDAFISLVNLKTDIYSKNIRADEIEEYISKVNAGVNPGYLNATFSWDRNTGVMTYTIPDYSDEDIPSVVLHR